MLSDVVFVGTTPINLLCCTWTDPPAGNVILVPSTASIRATSLSSLSRTIRITPERMHKNPAAKVPISTLAFFHGGCFPWLRVFGL